MLAIASGKGGCGKTTTALGIATATAQAGTPTQVVDLDLQMPDLHVLAGVDRQGVRTEDCPPEAAVEVRPAPGRPGVYVVPAPNEVNDRLLADALENLPPRPTVLDAAAGAGESAIRPLRLASHVLLVTTPNPQAIEDTLKTATMARELGTEIAGLAVRSSDALPEALADRFDLRPCQVYRLPRVNGPPLDDGRVQQVYRLISSRSREKGFITPVRTTIET